MAHSLLADITIRRPILSNISTLSAILKHNEPSSRNLFRRLKLLEGEMRRRDVGDLAVHLSIYQKKRLYMRYPKERSLSLNRGLSSVTRLAIVVLWVEEI